MENLSWISSLISMQCPLIRPEENHEDILRLLVEPVRSEPDQSHRGQILEWICQKILERHRKEPVGGTPVLNMKDDTDPTERLLSSFGIPLASEFFRGITKKGEQEAIWQLLVQILLAAQPDTEDERDEIGRRIDALADTNPLVLYQSKEVDLKLIPRDLEKELRLKYKKVATPSEKKLLEIRTVLSREISRYDREIAGLVLTTGSEFDPGSSERRTRALDHCQESQVSFNLDFVAKFQQWIDEQKDLKDPLSLGRSCRVAEASLKSMRQHADAQLNTKQDILAIRDHLKVLRALPAFQSKLNETLAGFD